jgi:pyruvate dehydrogenase E1 component alpha subunit
MRVLLEGRALWDDARQTALDEETARWVDEQVRAFETMPPQEPEEIFRHMYAELPPNLEQQMRSLPREVQR